MLRKSDNEVRAKDLLEWLPPEVVRSLLDETVTGRHRISEEREWTLIAKSTLCKDHYFMHTYLDKIDLDEEVRSVTADDCETIIAIYRNRKKVNFRAELIVEIEDGESK